MQEWETKLIETSVLTDVKCDFCKESCKRGKDFDYATISASFGYYSKCDGECRVFTICDTCYLKLLDIFKVDNNSGSYN